MKGSPAGGAPAGENKYTQWYEVKSGDTLWNALCMKYQDGARQAAEMAVTWQSLAGGIDPQRHKEVADRLAIQVADAAKWRDQILQYFQGFSKRPILAT